MTPERLAELLWRRIDGDMGAGEHEELGAALASDPEARRLEREIAALADGLRSAPRAAPPGALRERIDAALRAARPPGRTVSASAVVMRANPFRPLRQWLLLAAGLLIGGIAVHLVYLGSVQPVDGSRATGAMRSPAAAVGGAIIEDDLGRDVGVLTVSREARRVVVGLRSESRAELELAVEAATGTLGLVEARSSGAEDSRATAEGPRVALHASGATLLCLVVTPPASCQSLTLELRVDQRLAARHRIDLASWEDLP